MFCFCFRVGRVVGREMDFVFLTQLRASSFLKELSIHFYWFELHNMTPTSLFMLVFKLIFVLTLLCEPDLAGLFSSRQGFLVLVLRPPWTSGFWRFPEIGQNSCVCCVCVCGEKIHTSPYVFFPSNHQYIPLLTFTCWENRSHQKRMYPTLTT